MRRPSAIWRPSLYGWLGLLAWAITAPGLFGDARAYAPLITVALVSWLLGEGGWRSLGSWRTWLFLGGLIGVTALAEGIRPGLGAGLRMAARALAILLAADALALHVPALDLAALLEAVGLPGLGFALGVAFNLLPALRQTALDSWQALRLRGGPGKQPLQSLRRWAVTVLARALARGQEIVDAAESRAFTPSRRQVQPPRVRRGDLLLLLGLAAWTVVLLIM